MKNKLYAYILNRQKPIKGAIAYAIAWVCLHLGFEVDPQLAAILAGGVFAVVVERVQNWDVVLDDGNVQKFRPVDGNITRITMTGGVRDPGQR